MIRRSPELPSLRIFAWSYGLILVTVSIPALIHATQKQIVSPLMAVVLPVGSSVIGLACIMSALLVLRRFEQLGWPPREARLANWLLFYGCTGLAGLAIGLLRGEMMVAIKGPEASEWLRAAEYGLSTYATLLVATILEQQRNFVRTALAKSEEGQSAVRRLFESHEAWLQTRDRRRDELHHLLAQRVEPELNALHAALGSELTAEDAIPLCDRLDHLRDAEIRHLSHLLHPSIVDIGLHPALRGLVRRYRPSLEVVLEGDPGVLEGFPAALRLNLYRVVELFLENAAAGGDSRPVTIRFVREGEGARLEVAGAPGTFDVTRARRDGQFALLEARLALLEGSWEFLASSSSGLRVRVPANQG